MICECGTKTVLKNYAKGKMREKEGRKARKINRKCFKKAGKEYPDLSLSDEMDLEKPLFMRVASKFI